MSDDDERRAEKAAYMRDYRARNPNVVAADYRRRDARRRALARLGQRHPRELAKLIREELKR